MKSVRIGLPYKDKKVTKKTKFYIMKLYMKKSGKGKKKLVKKGGLIKATYSKKSKSLYFKTGSSLAKVHFAIVKVKSKKGKRAR